MARRRGCAGCCLIEPESGQWVGGYCPRCTRPAPKPENPTHGARRGPKPGDGHGQQVADITGQRFHRLLVLAFAGMRNGHAEWLCACDCGADRIVRGTKLRQKRIRSCGCWRADPNGMPRKVAAVKRRNKLRASAQ